MFNMYTLIGKILDIFSKSCGRSCSVHGYTVVSVQHVITFVAKLRLVSYINK